MDVSRALALHAFFPDNSRPVAFITLQTLPPGSVAPPTVAVPAAWILNLADAAALVAFDPDFAAASAVVASGHLVKNSA
ncbi:hypothetical protein MRS44_000382 [Fusarium solani]|jgi:hypothetical protein|uniref:uncharacterized protein n=1 Tax=Fusarium solani TaxID=169388 RepID=UPI0032C3F352|nr:hypothetical protein MRS44_000382 [Fusarium solani]